MLFSRTTLPRTGNGTKPSRFSPQPTTSAQHAAPANRLTITAPSTLKTRKDIGIGSPRQAVLAAYGKLRDPEAPSGDDAEVFIAGSIYGGVFFTFEADKVREIFLGAGAE